MRRKILGIFILLFIFNGAAGAAGAENKVVFFPFEAGAAGKYAPLKEGIASMLAGRLASKDGVTVVPEKINGENREEFVASYPEDSRRFFQRFDADYVGVGRLDAMGERLEINVVFYGVDDSTPLPLKVVALGEKDVIDAVDRLSVDIVGMIYDDTDGGIAEGGKNSSGLEAFQTEHPDRLYKKKIVSGAAIYTEKGGASFSVSDVSRRMTDLEESALAISLKDLDGDGTQEIVVLFKDSLGIFHYNRGMASQQGFYDLSPGVKAHAMNTADINSDGVNEIYVSATENGNFSSTVLAWTAEKGFTLIADSIRYGIRPLNIPGRGVMLIGQSSTMADDAFLKPGVFFLITNEELSEFQKGANINLPSDINLFDFVFADLDGDGSNEIVAFTDDMKMIVYGPDYRVRWISEEKYGASHVYLGSRWKDEESYHGLEYLPVQLRAVDTNGDGKTDIVSAGNEEVPVFEYFPNLRSFSGGKIVCLSWKNGGMTELWRTDRLAGYVSGFDISSTPILADNSNTLEHKEKLMETRLVVGRSIGKGVEKLLSFTGGKDNLIIYDLKLSSKTVISGRDE